MININPVALSLVGIFKLFKSHKHREFEESQLFTYIFFYIFPFLCSPNPFILSL